MKIYFFIYTWCLQDKTKQKEIVFTKTLTTIWLMRTHHHNMQNTWPREITSEKHILDIYRMAEVTLQNISENKEASAMHRSVRILSVKYLEVFPVTALHKSFIFHYWIISCISSNTLTLKIDRHRNSNSFTNASPITKQYRAELWTCSILKPKIFIWSK